MSKTIKRIIALALDTVTACTKFVAANGQVTIAGCSVTAKTLTIPSSINGNPVASVAIAPSPAAL